MPHVAPTQETTAELDAVIAEARQHLRYHATDTLLPFHVTQLARDFSTPDLRRILHDAELELHAASALDESDAGVWESLVDVYREVLRYRQWIDAHEQARRARSRFSRHVPRIDYEEIRARVDIVDYIGRYVDLKPAGREYKALCPFHSEKTPSFWVSPEKRGFYCHGCQAHGDVITFARMMGERL